MSWFPVDDALHSHPKAIKAGDEAIGFWSRAGSYCMAYLTDGFVPEWWVKQQPRGVVKARRLVSADLWNYPVEKDGERGYQFHQWKHECTKAVVLANREAARIRKANSRKARKESQGESRSESHRDGTSDSQRESRRSSGSNPTQPNPTHLSMVALGGAVASADASDSPPPDHCPRHPGGTLSPCGACGEAKARRRAFDLERARADAEVRRAEREQAAADRRDEIAACGLCDDEGYLNGRVCDHVDRTHQPGRLAALAAMKAAGGAK